MNASVRNRRISRARDRTSRARGPDVVATSIVLDCFLEMTSDLLVRVVGGGQSGAGRDMKRVLRRIEVGEVSRVPFFSVGAKQI